MYARLLPLALVLLLNPTGIPRALAQSLSLPDIGDYSQQYLSVDTERQLGAAVLQRIRDQGLIIEDVQLKEYLTSVGQRIVTYADQTGHNYTFYWVESPTVNAFAAPGAFIGINTGLLLNTDEESEFAGVIAHEIAHVSQRHIARAIADAKRLSLPIAAAMVASAILAASSGSSELGQAAVTGAMAANQQRQISFTRSNEQEADRIGYQLLYKSGFDPAGMSKFFNRLERLNGAAGRTPEYLLTHPFPRNRAADTQNRLPSKPRSSSLPHDKYAYFMAKARVQVLTTDNTDALARHFQKLLQTGAYQHQNAARYGYVLALKRAGRYTDAQKEVAKLRRADPNRLAFRIEEAEIALGSGDKQRAWRLFEEAGGLYPDDFSLAMHYGQALTTYGDAHKAMRLLEPHFKQRTNDAPLYALYAQAAQHVGDTAATHTALAEYYYLNNQLRGAIEQAELGLRTPSATPYQQARLRARLKQLKAEQQAVQ